MSFRTLLIPCTLALFSLPGFAGDNRHRRDPYTYDQQPVYEGYRGMDRNGDGRISRYEWRGNNNSFAQLDRNRDGWVTRNELNNNSRWNDDSRWNGTDSKRGKGHAKGRGRGHDKH
jgi:hypothetical protein